MQRPGRRYLSMLSAHLRCTGHGYVKQLGIDAVFSAGICKVWDSDSREFDLELLVALSRNCLKSILSQASASAAHLSSPHYLQCGRYSIDWTHRRSCPNIVGLGEQLVSFQEQTQDREDCVRLA